MRCVVTHEISRNHLPVKQVVSYLLNSTSGTGKQLSGAKPAQEDVLTDRRDMTERLLKAA